MKRILLTFFLIFFTNSYFLAQTQQIIAVEILDLCEDNVGQRLAYKIREEIRKSNAFRLTTFDESRLQIRIRSISYDEEYDAATIYSVIWLFRSPETAAIYFYDTFGYVGSSRINEVAERIVAKTDKMIQDLTKALNYYNTR